MLFAAPWKLTQIYQPARVDENCYLHVLTRAGYRLADKIFEYSHFIKHASTPPASVCAWGDEYDGWY